MSSIVDSSARLIHPNGLTLIMLILSCIFLGLSIVTVSMRTIARFRKGTFGWDDAFMIIGTTVYTLATSIAIYGMLVGLGRRQRVLNAWQQSEALKCYFIWTLNYVVALATVKSSVCITVMRIASNKTNMLIAIYVLLGITWASFFITFFGALLYCRPVETMWTPRTVQNGQGSCAPAEIFMIVGYIATAITIVTDLVLAIVPAVILWNMRMEKKRKLQAFGLLSSASIASIIVMVRIPYVNKYGSMKDLQFWLAHIMLCSNIEIGVGCIASSVASFRHLFREEHKRSGSGPSKRTSIIQPHMNIWTIGSGPRQYRAQLDSDMTSVHVQCEDNCERLYGPSSNQSDARDPQHLSRNDFKMIDIEKDETSI
ncbi:hypothetical protein ACN47E_009684 [Coniothyrium glycines]